MHDGQIKYETVACTWQVKEKCQISGLWLARDQIENPIYREQTCNWQAHDGQVK